MCTAMTLETAQGEVYLGRTMDFSVTLDPSLYFVPKGYRWGNLAATHTVRNQYSFIAVGQDASPVVFVDGVNEKGFGAAVLYFPGYAYYDPLDSGQDTRPPIASIELMHFLPVSYTHLDVYKRQEPDNPMYINDSSHAKTQAALIHRLICKPCRAKKAPA